MPTQGRLWPLRNAQAFQKRTPNDGPNECRPLKGWAEGKTIKEAAVRTRLRVLYRITFAIESVFSAATAAAFLESTSPYLDNRSPIAVLATTDPVEEAETAVVAATRALLGG